VFRSIVRRTIFLSVVAAGAALAQPAVRRTANVAALEAFPGYYHLRPIVVVGHLALQDNGQLRLEDDDARTVRVIQKGPASDGPSEVRGEYWDVGRLSPEDPRLAAYDLRATFQIDPEGAWPRSGQVTAIIASGVAPASPPSTPSIRAIVLYPTRYRDQRVTVKGQFSGRNLFGDLPDAPGNSRYDFVVRTADAAIWVSHIRPRGHDFDLALDARNDTGRWVEVTGTVRQGRGLQWLDATDGQLALTKPPADPPADAEAVPGPVGPPPEVLFSLPAQGETDVPTGTRVRIQFSRDIAAATLKDRVQVKYVQEEAADRGLLATPISTLTSDYQPAGRVLEIRFSTPLEAFRTVQVELLEGIQGTDDQPLKGWMLSFVTGRR